MRDEITRSLHARLVYTPIVGLRGEGSVFRRLRELRRIEMLPTRVLLERQRGRLAELLAFARERVPLYRERWNGIHDFADLPYLTKQDLQSERDRLEARGRPRRVSEKTTGGSTGQAVTLLKDRRATAAEMAASWLAYGWVGIQPGDRAARFWGSPTTHRRRMRALGASIAMRRLSFSAFAFTGSDLDEYWRACVRYRPAYLYGYVSMLEAFAQHLTHEGYDARELGLKAVITTSEVLSTPQRELLNRVFNVPVQNEYGCGEVGPVAYSCERSRLHVMSENLVVEVITDSGAAAEPGQVGEVVLTDLNNRAMPLVRYRVGDLAVQGDASCACGRGFPVLEKVWGRAYDFVCPPDGRRYHGEFFMYFFEDLRTSGYPVAQFQVVQVSSDELLIRLAAEPTVETVTAVTAGMAARLPTMHVNVEFVEAIPRTDSGKLRLIENRWVRSAQAPSSALSDT